MIGVVIVCHCGLAREFLNTLELIVGPVEGFQAVPIEPQQDVEKIRSEIAGALRKVDTGEGALILRDAKNCVLYSSEDGALALLGVRDLIVVRLKDVTLVCARDRAQEVRNLVKEARDRDGLQGLF